VREGYANIDRDGVRLHTGVRFMVNDRGFVATFEPPKVKAPPTNVYSLDDVTVEKVAGCSTCRGDVPKQALASLWAEMESGQNVA
jgi:hypothetical protein